MELDCPNCGSICQVVFEDDQVTEEHPLFCPFCGESVDEKFCEEQDEDYLDRLIEHQLND